MTDQHNTITVRFRLLHLRYLHKGQFFITMKTKQTLLLRTSQQAI